MTERDRDLDRLLTLVDAVVAIAITLLVLPLVEFTGELGTGTTPGELLEEHVAEIGAFLLSFAVIARLWLIQHRTLAHVVAQDSLLTGLLLLWTVTIVFLPFPTAMVAEAGGDWVTKVLYIGTMALSTLVLAAVHALLRQRPRLTEGEPRADPAGAVATAGVMVLALGISLAVPATSYFPLLLLTLDDRVLRAIRRRRTRLKE